MARSISKETRSDGAETRRALKRTAQSLFVQRDIDAVSIREIVEVAKQRNHASLYYHFGSKEALVRELVVDGARHIDERRKAMLEDIEASQTISVRTVLQALVLPVINFSTESEQATYVRFITRLQLYHRDLVRKALRNKWNFSYRRCLDHIKRLLPHIPEALIEQRLSIMQIYGNAILAAREAALNDVRQHQGFWAPAYTTDNILDTLEAVLRCTPSENTLEKLKKKQVRHTSLRK